MQLLAMHTSALLLLAPVLAGRHHALLQRGLGLQRGDRPGQPQRRCTVTGRIYGSHSDGVQLNQRVQQPRLPSHIVIETPKPVVSGLRVAIQNYSAGSFKEQPRVTFVTFEDDSPIERSPHGVPVLRSMFQAAIEEFPLADTYTYFNSDIAVDSTFLATADAVAAAAESGILKHRFLVTGKRTNVDWAPPTVDDGDRDSFTRGFQRGALFRADAEDYFMVSKSTWNWSDIPAFIVGHRGFDNWLVSEAALLPEIDLVDATATLHAMHMTDARIGNYEGHGASKDGADYNMLLMGHSSLVCGTTDGAEWATSLYDSGKVTFTRRPITCH